MLSPLIRQTIVLSLAQDVERKNHIYKHFSAIGINNFKFYSATPYDSLHVAEYYAKGLVKTFPDCFRCHKIECNCENNILIPQQVANWISFLGIWEAIAQNDGLFLVCEDDVIFYNNAIPLLNQVISDFAKKEDKVLIRLVASGENPEKYLNINVPLGVSDRRVMSNAAYIISGNMARYILESFNGIYHTSDVWLHSQLANNSEVHSITVEPLIGTDLSYNNLYAKFTSRIHPKGINEEDIQRLQAHKKRVSSEDEYNELRKVWLAY